MYLLDSNILIYSSKSEYSFLRNYIINQTETAAVSVTSIIEVLGYHKITNKDKTYFEACFSELRTSGITQPIIEKAITLRQKQKLSLGDAIIAATALVQNCALITRNIEDFKNIEELTIINPFP